MISIKKNSFNDNERLALHDSLNMAVAHFVNTYCKPTAKCQTCEYRHVCYDLIKARDYAYKIATEVTK